MEKTANGGLMKKKGTFKRELISMMYGFGDVSNPYDASVELLEDMVLDFIYEMTTRAIQIGKKGKLQTEDLVFLIRKDRKKYARAIELLQMNEELKAARKAFETDDMMNKADN
jgi:transcription initiation factor TFIID subunit 13